MFHYWRIRLVSVVPVNGLAVGLTNANKRGSSQLGWPCQKKTRFRNICGKTRTNMEYRGRNHSKRRYCNLNYVTDCV